jgi:hypothetical protein
MIKDNFPRSMIYKIEEKTIEECQQLNLNFLNIDKIQVRSTSVKTLTKTKSGRLYCLLCDIQIYKPSYHSMSHLCPFECEKCGVFFSTNESLLSHHKSCNNSNKKYMCNYCFRYFSTRSILNSHIKFGHDAGINNVSFELINLFIKMFIRLFKFEK